MKNLFRYEIYSIFTFFHLSVFFDDLHFLPLILDSLYLRGVSTQESLSYDGTVCYDLGVHCS